MQYNSKNLKYAKQMRSNMTKEESIMWNILRAKRFYGYKFKRQVLIGEYIVDFLCPEKMLVVELDGGQHNTEDKICYDDERSKYLNKQGYKVIRFWNNEVNSNLEGVCDVIKRGLDDTLSPALPQVRENN